MAVTEVLQSHLDDGEGHLRQVEEGLIPVHPHAKVHLGDGAQAIGLGDSEQQSELDPVTGEERYALQHPAAAGVLAGQRLNEARELRKEEVEQGPRGQLGDASATLSLELPAKLQGAPVEALDVMDLRIGEQWSE